MTLDGFLDSEGPLILIDWWQNRQKDTKTTNLTKGTIVHL